MRHVWSILLKGIAAILPVALTLYFIYWLSVSMERLLRPVISAVVPGDYYIPGMGLVAGLVLLFFFGLAVNAWIVQRVLRLGEQILERIPLIKSIYGAIRDFMEYFSTTEQRRDMKQVVMVSLGGVQLLGFVTREKLRDVPGLSQKENDLIAVYLPMSYQIGGYTIYLSRTQVEPLDMPMEDAMRMVLTAGLARSAKDG